MMGLARCTRCCKPLGYPSLSKICGTCAAREAALNATASEKKEAGLLLWVALGLGEFEAYLADCALLHQYGIYSHLERLHPPV